MEDTPVSISTSGPAKHENIEEAKTKTADCDDGKQEESEKIVLEERKGGELEIRDQQTKS